MIISNPEFFHVCVPVFLHFHISFQRISHFPSYPCLHDPIHQRIMFFFCESNSVFLLFNIFCIERISNFPTSPSLHDPIHQRGDCPATPLFHCIHNDGSSDDDDDGQWWAMMGNDGGLWWWAMMGSLEVMYFLKH